MAAASSAPPGAAPAEALCDSLQRRLMRWHQLGEAAEYYDLLNRGPYKPTVIHALNRFGGQMGPYVDARLQLRVILVTRKNIKVRKRLEMGVATTASTIYKQPYSAPLTAVVDADDDQALTLRMSQHSFPLTLESPRARNLAGCRDVRAREAILHS